MCIRDSRKYADLLGEWGLRQSQRVTRSEDQIKGMRGRAQQFGILIGVYDETDIDEKLWVGYRGGSSA